MRKTRIAFVGLVLLPLIVGTVWSQLPPPTLTPPGLNSQLPKQPTVTPPGPNLPGTNQPTLTPPGLNQPGIINQPTINPPTLTPPTMAPPTMTPPSLSSPQIPQMGPPPLQAPKSYTDYYNQNLRNYNRPPVNIRNYTIDKYYLQSPSVSPYLNLTRRTGAQSLNNYYRYVRPEVQRRSNLNPPMGTGRAPTPRFDSNPYFNQIYKPRIP